VTRPLAVRALALAAALSGLAVTTAAYLEREPLKARWWIHRLETGPKENVRALLKDRWRHEEFVDRQARALLQPEPGEVQVTFAARLDAVEGKVAVRASLENRSPKRVILIPALFVEVEGVATSGPLPPDYRERHLMTLDPGDRVEVTGVAGSVEPPASAGARITAQLYLLSFRIGDSWQVYASSDAVPVERGHGGR
jgi:hypothetical protein